MAILVKSSTLLIIVLTKRQRILNTPYQATKLPSYQATKLPSYQATKLPSYQATKLPSYQATEFRCDDEKNNWRSCKRG
jgi:hypothetical protein